MSIVHVDEIFFIQCMMRKGDHLEDLMEPNIGHYVVKNIKWVLSNVGSTCPFGCAGVIHLITKGMGEDLSGYQSVPRIKSLLDESTLRRMQILNPTKAPLHNLYLGRKTGLTFMSIFFENKNTWN